MEKYLERVRRAIDTGGLKKKDIALEAGIHRNSLKGVESADWDPRVSTLTRVLDAIKVIEKRDAHEAPARPHSDPGA